MFTSPVAQSRLPFRSSADTEGEVQRVLGKLEGAGGRLGLSQILANSAAGFRPYISMSDALMNRSSVPPALREALILRLAILSNAPFLWNEHISMSEATGISKDERDAIAEGSLDGVRDEFRPALEAAAELAGGGYLDAATWSKLVDRWDSTGAFEIVLVIAWWGGFIGTVIGGTDLRSRE